MDSSSLSSPWKGEKYSGSEIFMAGPIWLENIGSIHCCCFLPHQNSIGKEGVKIGQPNGLPKYYGELTGKLQVSGVWNRIILGGLCISPFLSLRHTGLDQTVFYYYILLYYSHVIKKIDNPTLVYITHMFASLKIFRRWSCLSTQHSIIVFSRPLSQLLI